MLTLATKTLSLKLKRMQTLVHWLMLWKSEPESELQSKSDQELQWLYFQRLYSDTQSYYPGWAHWS